MNFKDIQLEPISNETRSLKISDDITLEILQYLPIKDKGDFVTYVINNSIDENTGCFSPIRLNVFFSLGIIKWYANVDFDENDDPALLYDLLEVNHIIDKILELIPSDEQTFINDLVDNTAEDIARYNNSFAGMLSNMNSDAINLDKSIQDILEKIKNKEGLEVLSEIQNVVGKD